MNIFKRKPKPKPSDKNGKDECCATKIKNAHGKYRDYLKGVQEQSRKNIENNGSWLNLDQNSEG